MKQAQFTCKCKHTFTPPNNPQPWPGTDFFMVDCPGCGSSLLFKKSEAGILYRRPQFKSFASKIKQ